MQTTEVIISNILPTETGFGVVAGDTGQSVFIPSRLMHGKGFNIGDRINALLVPNPTHQDKTPWLAISIEDNAPAQAKDDLAEKILADLEEGRATLREIAESIGAKESDVRAKMIEMAGMGQIISYTVFDLPED